MRHFKMLSLTLVLVLFACSGNSQKGLFEVLSRWPSERTFVGRDTHSSKDTVYNVEGASDHFLRVPNYSFGGKDGVLALHYRNDSLLSFSWYLAPYSQWLLPPSWSSSKTVATDQNATVSDFEDMEKTFTEHFGKGIIIRSDTNWRTYWNGQVELSFDSKKKSLEVASFRGDTLLTEPVANRYFDVHDIEGLGPSGVPADSLRSFKILTDTNVQVRSGKWVRTIGCARSVNGYPGKTAYMFGSDSTIVGVNWSPDFVFLNKFVRQRLEGEVRNVLGVPKTSEAGELTWDLDPAVFVFFYNDFTIQMMIVEAAAREFMNPK